MSIDIKLSLFFNGPFYEYSILLNHHLMIFFHGK